MPRNYPLRMRCDISGRPYLDGTDTPLYNCLASRIIGDDEAYDLLANVHLADKEVGRLNLLVLANKRPLSYLYLKYPLVFNDYRIL